MVRRVVRMLELPVSLSLGVVRHSASLAGRVVSRLLVSGGPSEPPAEPPKPPAPVAQPATPTAVDLESDPERPSTGREAAVEEATEPQETPRPEETLSPDETAAPEENVQREGPEKTPGPGSSAPEPEPVGNVEHEPGAGTSVRAPDPHSPLNTPIGEPEPTEWPDPYDKREDPRDAPAGEGMVFGDEIHPPTGATSTSEPHPGRDPEAEPWEGPKRDRVDR